MNGFLRFQFGHGTDAVRFAVPDFWLATGDKPSRPDIEQLAHAFEGVVPPLSDATEVLLAMTQQRTVGAASWVLTCSHRWQASCVVSLKWLMEEHDRCRESWVALWVAVDHLHRLAHASIFEEVNEQGADEAWQELRETLSSYLAEHPWLWDLESRG